MRRASAETRVRIDSWGRQIDPCRNATHVLAGDVLNLLQKVSGVADAGWSAVWREAAGALSSHRRLDDQTKNPRSPRPVEESASIDSCPGLVPSRSVLIDRG